MNRLDAYRVPLGGLHLIEASAGTGKTHAISTLYLRAVVELGLLPEQILVVTFTRAATGELGERIRARLRLAQAYLTDNQVECDSELAEYLSRQSAGSRCRARIARALLVVDQAAVMTIHGFCARILEQNAFESRLPFGTELVESTEPLIAEIVNDFVLTRVAERPQVELLALRAVGIDAERLRSLAELASRRDRALIEPEVGDTENELDAVLEELECNRRQAHEWLKDQSHWSLLGRLNKTKPKDGIGTRVAQWIEKSSNWLEAPFFLLHGKCEAFERFFELLEKNPTAATEPLLAWFAELKKCNVGFDRLRQTMLENGVRLQREFLEYLGDELELRKRTRAIQAYDDLLRRLRVALSSSAGSTLISGLRQRFPLALIDEFQDTDPIQFEVFSRIYDEKVSLFVIGDPKQSIYAFRGADVDSYLLAKQDPRIQCHTLDVNWRSDPLLLTGIELLYRSHADPFLSAGIDYVPITPRPSAEDLHDEAGEAISGVRLLLVDSNDEPTDKAMPKYRARRLAMNATVRYIGALLTTKPVGWRRPISASDIAVLGRTNRDCLQVANALRNHGIRCVQTSQSSVLGSDAAGSLCALLGALLSPNEPQRVVALLVDDLLGLEPREIELLRGDVGGWEQWTERLLGYRRNWERSGLLSVVVRLSSDLGMKLRLLRNASGERFITDLFHVAELVQTAARQQHLTLEAQLEWLERGRTGESDVLIEEQQLRIEADSQAVLLTTVHRSKGLQFPFVVCPFFWDSGVRRPGKNLAFRRPASHGRGGFDVLHLEPKLLDPDAPEWQLARVGEQRENARLLYVALTRAKHQVAVLWANAQGSEASPLYYLLRDARDDASGSSKTGGFSSQGLREAFVGANEPSAIQATVIDGSAETRVVEVSPDADRMLTMPARLERILEPAVRTTSYSALTAVSLVHGDVGRDVDALPFADAAGSGAESTAAAVELPLQDLPRGARTGEALHAILEVVDFRDFDRLSAQPEVTAVLERFGLDPECFELPVRRALRAAMDLPLLPGNERLRLCNVAKESRRSEVEFIMKISSLSVERLATCLEPVMTGLPADYRRDLERLRFDPVSGYLRGFIDLVFELDGRYYIADYKSNALGDSSDCYTPTRIREEMRRHHYPVQAAIYTAAVDQWLRLTQVNYDYELHFGGVFYLFLRGMVPELGPGSGVFFHRPSVEGVRGFEAMLEGQAS